MGAGQSPSRKHRPAARTKEASPGTAVPGSAARRSCDTPHPNLVDRVDADAWEWCDPDETAEPEPDPGDFWVEPDWDDE